jgi:hypothetical protein
MSRRSLILIAGVILVSVLFVIVITAAFTPGDTHPAFAAAVSFMNAAGKGDDAAAMPYLSPELQAYVGANCPAGSVSACVDAYTPPEWGALISAVFRRAAPVGRAWNVELIANYERDTGASGVCSFYRIEQDAGGAWLITEWAGFIHCSDARDMATNPDTPNRAP